MTWTMPKNFWTEQWLWRSQVGWGEVVKAPLRPHRKDLPARKVPRWWSRLQNMLSHRPSEVWKSWIPEFWMKRKMFLTRPLMSIQTTGWTFWPGSRSLEIPNSLFWLQPLGKREAFSTLLTCRGQAFEGCRPLTRPSNCVAKLSTFEGLLGLRLHLAACFVAGEDASGL